MARRFTAGAETNHINTEGYTASGTVVLGTTQVRTGSRSFDCTAGGSVAFQSITTVLGDTLYARCAAYFPSLAGGDVMSIRASGGGTTYCTVSVNGDGSVSLSDLPSGVVATSTAGDVTANSWHVYELALLINTGATDRVEARVDGVSIGSASSQNITDTVANQGVWFGGASSGYIDDIAINDSTGASQNSWPGVGRVVLLLPISDNARAALWTGGAGGTTNLFDAVNNTPPIGTATETNLTQIEHAGGAAGSTDSYDANMTTYASAGIGPSDIINVISFIEVDGEDVAVGSKLLAFSVVSNPAIATPGNVTAGNDAGALGTYPTTWTVRINQGITYNPTVTVGTSPVMRARRPETASRVASVCFMGMYVDYTERRSPPFGHRHRGLIVR